MHCFFFLKRRAVMAHTRMTLQKMAPQVRQQRLHVEREQREWMFAFNINISLTSLFG